MHESKSWILIPGFSLKLSRLIYSRETETGRHYNNTWCVDNNIIIKVNRTVPRRKSSSFLTLLAVRISFVLRMLPKLIIILKRKKKRTIGTFHSNTWRIHQNSFLKPFANLHCFSYILTGSLILFYALYHPLSFFLVLQLHLFLCFFLFNFFTMILVSNWSYYDCSCLFVCKMGTYNNNNLRGV